MRLRKSIFMLVMYLLPAFTVLAGYAVYHETLTKKPTCLANCGSSDPLPSKKRNIQNTLDLIDQLAKYKAQLMGDIRDFSNPDLSFLQSRLAQFEHPYDVISRYGNGFLHHSWARLNAELNAKINDYVNSQYVNYFLAQGISPLVNPYSVSKNPAGSRENLANSFLPKNDGLIPLALARDILPPGSNYFVAPSNLNGGGGGSNNPGIPGNPISAVPLPSAVYFMLSGLVLLMGLRYKNRLSPSAI